MQQQRREKKNKEWSSDEPFKGSSGESDSQELRERKKNAGCVAEQILILLIQVNGRKDPEGYLKCKMKCSRKVGYCVTVQS